VLPTDLPATTATDADALELATLERLVREVPVPSPDLPGWQSLTAREYAAAVHELADLLGTVASALASARAAG
jgi:histone H3/H4